MRSTAKFKKRAGQAPRKKRPPSSTTAPMPGVIIAFLIVNSLLDRDMLSRSFSGQLVPICCYVVMAVLPQPDSRHPRRAQPGPRGLHERGRLLRHRGGHEPAVGHPLGCAAAGHCPRGGARPSPPWRVHRRSARAAPARRLSGHRHARLRRDHQGAHQLPDRRL